MKRNQYLTFILQQTKPNQHATRTVFIPEKSFNKINTIFTGPSKPCIRRDPSKMFSLGYHEGIRPKWSHGGDMWGPIQNVLPGAPWGDPSKMFLDESPTRCMSWEPCIYQCHMWHCDNHQAAVSHPTISQIKINHELISHNTAWEYLWVKFVWYFLQQMLGAL